MNDEKTIYDNEKTQYQSQNAEATQYDAAYEKEMNSPEEENPSEENQSEKKNSKFSWRQVTVGAASGILLGATGAMLSGSTTQSAVQEEPGGGGGNEDHPVWTDGEVSIATSVTDDMSFSEAFAAARAEVGAGGAFEWHGQVYGTYYADEWNAMTPEQRDEYGSHFNWNNYSSDYTAHTSHSTSDTHDIHQTDDVDVIAAENHNEHVNQDHEIAHTDADVSDASITGHAEEVAIIDADPEVEILGVVHDDETGANIGGMVIDGQDVVLIDVDGDSTFDVMGADSNGDQQFSPDELVDISGENVTVDDLGGIANTDDSMYTATDNDIDYTSDAGIYDA